MPTKPRPKIVKRYTVYNGNRFARVRFPDGREVDVRVRTGRQGIELTRAADIVAVAAKQVA